MVGQNSHVPETIHIQYLPDSLFLYSGGGQTTSHGQYKPLVPVVMSNHSYSIVYRNHLCSKKNTCYKKDSSRIALRKKTLTFFQNVSVKTMIDTLVFRRKLHIIPIKAGQIGLRTAWSMKLFPAELHFN